MFGRNKKKKEEEAKKGGKTLEKIVMGAVIGGAIGSVLGASIAPKEGKETRKDVAEFTKSATKKSKTIFNKIKGIFAKTEKNEDHQMREIPNENEVES